MEENDYGCISINNLTSEIFIFNLTLVVILQCKRGIIQKRIKSGVISKCQQVTCGQTNSAFCWVIMGTVIDVGGFYFKIIVDPSPRLDMRRLETGE